jgi:hypothetical protein
VAALQDALVRNTLGRQFNYHTPTLPEEITVFEVNGAPLQDNIGYFSHPISVMLPKHIADGAKIQHASFLDLRNLGRYVGSEFRIQDRANYILQHLRTVLGHIFEFAQPSALKDMGSFPATVFGKFVSQPLARNFMLEPSQEVYLNVIATYYYYCLFVDEVELEAEERDKVVAQTARATNVPADRVYDIMDGVDMIHDLEKLADVIKLRVNSVRLQNFTYGTILQMLCGNWMGNASREMVGVALEHPPTWIALIYGSIGEASFKRTQLGKIVDTQARVRSEVPETFVRNVNTLTGFIDYLPQLEKA